MLNSTCYHFVSSFMKSGEEDNCLIEKKFKLQMLIMRVVFCDNLLMYVCTLGYFYIWCFRMYIPCMYLVRIILLVLM